MPLQQGLAKSWHVLVHGFCWWQGKDFSFCSLFLFCSCWLCVGEWEWDVVDVPHVECVLNVC